MAGQVVLEWRDGTVFLLARVMGAKAAEDADKTLGKQEYELRVINLPNVKGFAEFTEDSTK